MGRCRPTWLRIVDKTDLVILEKSILEYQCTYNIDNISGAGWASE